MEKQNLNLEPFARAFAKHADRTVAERIAYGMKENAKYQALSFMENCMLPEKESRERWVLRHLPYRDGIYTGGCSPFSRAADNGKAVAALPNGKKKGEANFADSVASTPGCDHCGPTALVNSMLRYDQKEVCSGFVSQMKFTSATYNTEKGQAAFIALAKTYFANGGQQLSINVLDRKALLAAREDPENYRNLIVRVGGYSDYFVRLTPELQQNVIDRTDIAL